eukprot:3755034-Prymnesium_polylepis.1
MNRSFGRHIVRGAVREHARAAASGAAGEAHGPVAKDCADCGLCERRRRRAGADAWQITVLYGGLWPMADGGARGRCRALRRPA